MLTCCEEAVVANIGDVQPSPVIDLSRHAQPSGKILGMADPFVFLVFRLSFLRFGRRHYTQFVLTLASVLIHDYRPSPRGSLPQPALLRYSTVALERRHLKSGPFTPSIPCWFSSIGRSVGASAARCSRKSVPATVRRLFRHLSNELSAEFGKGFSQPNPLRLDAEGAYRPLRQLPQAGEPVAPIAVAGGGVPAVCCMQPVIG